MLSPHAEKWGDASTPSPTDRRPCVYHLQFRAVHVADAVATQEVKTYNFIARLRPFPRFAETISQGELAQRIIFGRVTANSDIWYKKKTFVDLALS